MYSFQALTLSVSVNRPLAFLEEQVTVKLYLFSFKDLPDNLFATWQVSRHHTISNPRQLNKKCRLCDRKKYLYATPNRDSDGY